MLTILTVCTGNVCRSPIAEQLLAHRLNGLQIRLESAGTRARDGVPMSPEAAKMAVSLGVPRSLPAAHKARYLTHGRLANANLALAMARDHRKEIVELDPSFLRRTFTVRELHRLLVSAPDGALERAADCAPQPGPGPRLAAMLALVASLRGTMAPPRDPEVDDVVDPIGRSRETYERSVAQINEALPSVERLLRLSFG